MCKSYGVLPKKFRLEDDSVDLIVSNNGINNVADLGRVLAECNRVMKVNGQFVLSVNLDTTMIEFYSVLEQVLSDLGMRETILKIREHIYGKRKPLTELKTLSETKWICSAKYCGRSVYLSVCGRNHPVSAFFYASCLSAFLEKYCAGGKAGFRSLNESKPV